MKSLVLGQDEKFCAESILHYLKTKTLGRKIEFLLETHSTQAIAGELAANGAAEGLLVVADTQWAGRGRSQNRWDSPKGLNLYFSLLFRPEKPFLPLARANEIQFMAAVAVAQSLQELCGLSVELKWPNDIWLKGKKLGGIILTTVSPDPEKIKSIILGVGMNLNAAEKDFSDEIKKIATSVFLQTGKKVNRSQFLAGLLQELAATYQALQSGSFEKIRQKWHGFAPKMINHPVKILNVLAHPGNQQMKVLEGEAKGIDAECRLLVEDRVSAQLLHILDGELQYH